MIIDKKAFAEQVYQFFLKNDDAIRYEGNLPEESVSEIEAYFTDLAMVKDMMRDIEEIADEFISHEAYVVEAKPILRGLQELKDSLEAEQRKRMVSDTGYEVKHAIHIGDKEIRFAINENAKDGMHYFVGDFTENELFGEYSNCQVSDEFLEAIKEFTGRVSKQIEGMLEEVRQNGLPSELFTAEHCYPNDYKQSIDGKIVAIRADVFRPEYRRGYVQLVLVDGGSGARAEPMGRSVYGYHLNDGKYARFYRSDVQGEPKRLPEWAKAKATAIQAEKNTPKKYPKEMER